MREYRLSELYDNVSTNSLSRALLYENGDVLNLHYGDIHLKYSGLLDINKAELPFALKTDYKFKESSRMETGDVIFADAAEDYEGIGKAVEIGQTGDTPSYAGLHTIHLKRRTDNLASGYMGYLSQAYAFRRKVWFIAQGAKVLGISSKELLKQSIVIPNITEQNTIVSRLKAVDQKINLLTKKKEALETYKKGLMQKIFSQELRFKREDGTDYPEWERCSLGDVGDLQNGFAFKSDSYVEKGDYSIVTIKNVQNGKLIKGFNYINELPKNIKKHHRLKMDDLLISMTGNVGRVCLVNQKNLLLNQRVGLIVLTDEMDKRLCFYQLQQKSMLNYFITNGEGAAQPNISKDVILNAQLRFPTDNKEKIKVVNFFSRVDILIDNVQDSLESAVKLKKGLLQQMFV